MFTGAHNFVLRNNHFIDQRIGVNQFISQQVDVEATGINILREASNIDAAYDSSARDPAPKCFPGTREQFVEDIIHWAVPAVGADDPLPIFWMKGPAGVGKSAVAQTCAGTLKAMGKLGATFFFVVNKRDKALEFFPTIIYQLSSEFPNYGDLVDRRIRRDRTILNRTMATQFRVLVVEPMRELEKRGDGIGNRIAIFVDGLDECEDADAQCEIIGIVSAAARDGTLPFCWAFFSRPEPHIEGAFTSDDIAPITYTTLLPVSRDADGDIELYLRGGFKNILRRHNVSLKSQWPSNDDILTLVHAANGLFIYAATALRFVAQHGSLLEESLRAILATISNQGYRRTTTGALASPFAELDAFYTLIMQRIPPENLLTALLFMCASAPEFGTNQRSALFMSNLLGLSELAFKTVCSQLSAVIHFQGQDELPPTHTADTSRPFQYASREVVNQLWDFITTHLGGSISFHHKSFYDFLIDPTRSGPFHILSLAIRNAMFKRCVDLHLKYQESYCFQGSELVLAPGVPDSAFSLSYPYINELINSSLKAYMIVSAHRMCMALFTFSSVDPRLLQQFQHVDFRKHLHIDSSLHSPGEISSMRVWKYRGLIKFTSGVRLFQHLSQDVRVFLPGFEEMIKQLQQAGIIQACDTSCVSSFMDSLPPESRRVFISGLYHMGHGSKAIFWYWEFDAESRLYRELMTVDLSDGGRIYREERFDLWPLGKE